MALGSTATAGDYNAVSKKWHPWIEIGGYASSEDSRGEAALFVPLWQSLNAMLFVDARGKLFHEADYEGNLAVGLRAMHPTGWNFGGWVGWDNRRTEAGSTFNQIAFGIEALRADFDFRANAYIPLDDSALVSRTNSVGALLSGNSIFVQQTTSTRRELALYGVDAEVGFRVPLERLHNGGAGNDIDFSGLARHEVRLYGGGFWFDNDDFNDDIAGPRGRLEYRINDIIPDLPGSRLTFEAEAQYDDVREERFEAGVRLRVPFGLPGKGRDYGTALASLNAQEWRMMEGLERDTDVVASSQTETTQSTESAIDDITNVALNQVAFATDQASLAAAVATGANTLIIAQGGTVFDLTAAGGQTLQASQTLQGGSSTINIRGATTGTVVPFTAPGSKPTMRNTANSAVIEVANDTHVAGVGLTGAGAASGLVNNRGIFAPMDGISNVAITAGTMIMDIGNEGILFANNHDKIRIYHTTIARTDGEGIEFLSDNSNITIGHTTISDTGNEGIDLNDRNTNVTIHHVTVNDATGDGIDFDNNNFNVTIRDTTIADTMDLGGSDAIEIEDNNNTFLIQNVTITNPDGDGIDLDFNNTGFTIVDTTIVNPDQDGIRLFERNTGIMISNVTITGGAAMMEDGIDINNNNGVTITGTTISNAGFEGLFIGGMNNTVTMNTTTFSGTFGDDVIDINAGNNTFAGTGNVFNGTFSGVFCEVTGMQTGSFGFSTGPQPTCP